MSFNRDNIVWKSPATGQWHLGFYRVFEGDGYGDEDYDPEWDVDYDYSTFEWVSDGCSNEQAAIDSWTGSNPGMFTTTTDAKVSAKLDTMRAALISKRAR